MNSQLSGGAIESIMSGSMVDKPVLQVLGQKKIAGGGADRYRLLLSDGLHSLSSAMLATQLNEMVTSGQLGSYAVIRLDKYLSNPIQGDKRVIILLEVTVVTPGDQVGSKLGNPQAYRPGAQAAQAAQADPPQAAPQAAPAPASRPLAQQQNFYTGGGGQAASPAQPPQQKKPFSVQSVQSGQGATPTKVHPIASLTPYQNRWTIKVRVTNKSAIRTWSNSRGEGKLFNMNLLDESGEIRATLFKDEVDKFYDQIEMNKVYLVRKASLKTADKRYSSIANDYEMTFNRETEMIPCDDDDGLPNVTFNFVEINRLEGVEPTTLVDVIGVVKQVNDISTIIGKASNKEIKKRDIQLVDKSQVLVRMTLWGQEAEAFKHDNNPVLAVKGCKLSDFGGRSLSALSSSQMVINPDIPEAHQLRGWYDEVGCTLQYSEYQSEGSQGGGGHAANWKTFAQAKQENLGQDKADYFCTKGTITHMRKENCMYMACPTDNCNKKLIDQGNGYFRCEKCNQEFPNYKWRLILSANLADFTDNQWVTCFQDTAEVVLGRASDEVGRLRESDEAGFDQLFQDSSFKTYTFNMRAKVETYNDEQRLKVVCVKAQPLDFVEYNKRLVTQIDELLAA